jgi:hypothetical protein
VKVGHRQAPNAKRPVKRLGVFFRIHQRILRKTYYYFTYAFQPHSSSAGERLKFVFPHRSSGNIGADLFYVFIPFVGADSLNS